MRNKRPVAGLGKKKQPELQKLDAKQRNFFKNFGEQHPINDLE